MLGFLEGKRICIIINILSLLYVPQIKAQSEKVISLQEIRPDIACGPRCLWALMKITKAGQPECGIKCIYELIGKEPFSVTNFKDLKDAAEQLGFTAEGYKLTTRALTKENGYAILPVGNVSATAEDPQHFILVKRLTKDFAIVVNTRTLVSQALAISDLCDYWSGYALIITASKGMPPLIKEPDDIKELPMNIKKKYDHIKDFGQVDNGSVVEHTFTIDTEEGKDYKAKIVQKSCSCLAAKLGKNIKGQHTLTMELHVDDAAWQEAHAVVLFEPGGIIKRYAVRAYCKDTYQIFPYMAHIEAPDGGVIEYPVKINYYTGSDDIVDFNRMLSNHPNLKCGPVKSSSKTKKGAIIFTFEIPLIFDAGEPSSGIENFNGNVDFVLETGQGQRHIPLQISARIGTEKFRLIPEKVFLMASKSDDVFVHQRVKLEFLTEHIPANIDVLSNKSLPLEIRKESVSANTYMIDVTVKPEKLREISLGLNKEDVTISSGGIFNPINLPISLFVRE